MKDLEKKLRSWVWHRLVFLADRISPEDAFRATGLRIHLKKGVGWVLDDDKGVQIWYKGQREYDKHSHDGYDEEPEFHPNITVTSDLTKEDIENAARNALWWSVVNR